MSIRKKTTQECTHEKKALNAKKEVFK